MPAGRPPCQPIQARTNGDGGEGCDGENRRHPESGAKHGCRRHRVRKAAGVCNQTGNRGAERDSSLLHGGDGQCGDVLLAGLAPLMTCCAMKAQQAPMPIPIAAIGSGSAATGPGAISTPTPSRPLAITVGPAMISRGGHAADSDATLSAAVVHASEDPATMYPAVSG
jgi:hypothetical protein